MIAGVEVAQLHHHAVVDAADRQVVPEGEGGNGVGRTDHEADRLRHVAAGRRRQVEEDLDLVSRLHRDEGDVEHVPSLAVAKGGVTAQLPLDRVRGAGRGGEHGERDEEMTHSSLLSGRTRHPSPARRGS